MKWNQWLNRDRPLRQSPGEHRARESVILDCQRRDSRSESGWGLSVALMAVLARSMGDRAVLEREMHVVRVRFDSSEARVFFPGWQRKH